MRELENLLHRALALAGGEWIDAGDLGLPDTLLDDGQGELAFGGGGALSPPAAPAPEGLSLPDELPTDLAQYLDEVERAILLRALEQHRFNRTPAAANVGLSLRRIRYRMARPAQVFVRPCDRDYPVSGSALSESAGRPVRRVTTMGQTQHWRGRQRGCGPPAQCPCGSRDAGPVLIGENCSTARGADQIAGRV